ncbi:MAG TPA: PrsW family glutamic-type intramembrane protease [Acidimicrobiia bacterium]|nr:PrsW family glutamic-type intramembrane protease [Acidimicrobiia bacterium]
MRGYRIAALVAVLAFGSILWGLIAPTQPQPFAFGALLLPLAVLLAVKERLGEKLSLTAGVAGTGIGVAVALLSHGLVLGFAYLFFLGFADRGVDLLTAFRLAPRLALLLGSPWVILILVEYVIVAPLTEEVGKAWGAALSRPQSRRQAFFAGVAAGTGFAIVENMVYAAFTDLAWNEILLARSLGAAVHPLATGLVMIGWWERRENKRSWGKRLLAGSGVHSLWNGSLVVLIVTETAYVTAGSAPSFTQASLAYAAAVGALAAGVLWRATAAVAAERIQLTTVQFRDASDLGAWTVLSASFLVPVAMLLLTFSDFYSEPQREVGDLTSGWEIIAVSEFAGADASLRRPTAFMSIVGSDSELLVVGADPFNSQYEGLWKSDDARTWAAIDTTGLPEDEWISLETWWQGRFWALADQRIWRSADGTSWEQSAPPPGGFGPIFQVVEGGPGLAAISQSAIWVSADGETWEVALEDFSNPLGTLAANPRGHLLALSEDGLILWSSFDGTSWTKAELAERLPPSYGDLFGLIGTEKGWAYISGAADNIDESPQPNAWWSEDGTTWKRVDVRSQTPGAFVSGITAFPGGMVAAGVPGMWVSTDGQVWNFVPAPDFAWETDVAVWNEKIIAVGFWEYPMVWMRPIVES